MDQANATHSYWMKRALTLAQATGRLGNVPVGAVIVRDGELIAEAANLRHTTQDPTAHAECLAIRKAAQKLASWRLERTTIYVTLEPCSMCVGAIEQARITTLVYGTDDPQGGAFSGNSSFRSAKSLTLIQGVLRDECQKLLTTFFSKLRSKTSGK